MLKKVILFYHALVGIYSIISSLLALIEGVWKSWHLIWAIIGLLLVIISAKALLELESSRYNKFFILFNLPQVLTISLFGYIYKIIFGSELFLFFKNYPESILTFHYRYFYRDFYLEGINNPEFVFVGINLVQLFIVLYFWYHLPIKEKNIKDWFKST